MKKIIFSLIFTASLLLLQHQVVAAQESVFGPIEAPAGVSDFNDQAEGGIGVLKFISNMIKIASVVAGIWVMFNFITAGFTYVTSGDDSGAISKIGSKLSLSVTGLVLIVASYTIAGLIGLIVFGDATYILNPEIPTAIEDAGT